MFSDEHVIAGLQWAMPTDFDDWFVHEILVHERALAQYLHRCWPHRDDLHDLRQEVYARVYEAAARNRVAAS